MQHTRKDRILGINLRGRKLGLISHIFRLSQVDLSPKCQVHKDFFQDSKRYNLWGNFHRKSISRYGGLSGNGAAIRYTLKNVAFSWLIFSTYPYIQNEFFVFLSRYLYIDEISAIRFVWVYGRVEKMSLKIAFRVIILVVLSHYF